ncbi:MAG: universal stress protein [Burkholderiales bacterium]|nr:universal stress protein [Burkholderiales bacterium]
MFKILLATDGSEHAKRALGKVIALSATMRAPAQVHVLNIQEKPVVYGAAEIYLPYDKAEQLVREAGQKIADDVAEGLRGAGLTAAAEVAIGDIAPSIARRASELGCDLIVMGTRGMGAVANLVLGSVATKVIHMADVPVMLVH